MRCTLLAIFTIFAVFASTYGCRLRTSFTTNVTIQRPQCIQVCVNATDERTAEERNQPGGPIYWIVIKIVNKKTCQRQVVKIPIGYGTGFKCFEIKLCHVFMTQQVFSVTTRCTQFCRNNGVKTAVNQQSFTNQVSTGAVPQQCKAESEATCSDMTAFGTLTSNNELPPTYDLTSNVLVSNLGPHRGFIWCRLRLRVGIRMVRRCSAHWSLPGDCVDRRFVRLSWFNPLRPPRGWYKCTYKQPITRDGHPRLAGS